MPGHLHENLYVQFTRILRIKLAEMKVRKSDLIETGSAIFQGNQNSKRADSGFKPSRHRPGESWPTLVIECAVSESLERLRGDGSRWLQNSEAPQDVKIALLFRATKADRRIHIEMWEISDVPNPLASRAHPHPHKPSPTKIHELDIIGDDATCDVIGAPLTLDFEKIFLREPRQGQGDIVFNIRDLKAYAANVWRGIE